MANTKQTSWLSKIRSGLATSASLVAALIFSIIFLLPFYIYTKYFVYRSRYNRPVYTFMPPIAQEYHKCFLCESYDGGIYGKGPLKQFRSDKAKRCIHQWQLISKKDFVAGVKLNFNVDLANLGSE